MKICRNFFDDFVFQLLGRKTVGFSGNYLMDETELMLRVKEGDEDAFREIVEKYQQQIINLCFRYVGNQQDAEEVAQDVFIHLYRAASKYEPRAKLSTYLYRIAVNLSLNRIRDDKWKRFISWEFIGKGDKKSASSPMVDGPDSLVERKEQYRIIDEAINSLPTNQKTAVILKRFQGLSYEEIAEVMNCSVSAVESRLHRARQTLKKKLKHLLPQ